MPKEKLDPQPEPPQPPKETSPPKKNLQKSKTALIFILGFSLLAIAGGVIWFYFNSNPKSTDTQAPEIQLTSPTAENWYSTDQDKISLKGVAVDEIGVTRLNYYLGKRSRTKWFHHPF